MRFLKPSFSLIISALGCSLISAAALEVTPGELGNLLTQTTPEAQLQLSGSADIRDLIVLKSLPADVKGLDLTNLKLQTYDSKKAVYLGKTLIQGNRLPAYIFFRSAFSNILLPEGITIIEDGAFAGAEIESVIIPEGVTQIGDYAFYNAPYLKSVSLPSTLTKVGKGAFANCPNLTDINLSSTELKEIPERCFAGDSRLESLDLYNIDAIGTEAFSGTAITQLILPEVNYFAPYALAGMDMLAELTLNSNAKFNEGTLMNNRNLVQLSGTPDNVPPLFAANCVSYSPAEALTRATTVGDYAFSNSAVTELYLGANLTSVGKGIFSGVENLTSINATALGSNIPAADDDAFTGIEPSKIRLKVADGKTPEWQNDPVWGQFDVYDDMYSGIENPDLAQEVSGIDITLTADSIEITAPENIDIAALYDAEGKLINIINNAGNQTSLSLASAPSGVLILSVKAGNHSKNIKLIH